MQFRVGLLDFVLNVQQLLIIFRPFLIDSILGLADRRVETTAVDWQIDSDSDFTAEITLRAGGLPVGVVVTIDFGVRVILLLGKGEIGLARGDLAGQGREFRALRCGQLLKFGGIRY